MLFVCFNITLVDYIKRLLVQKGVGLGADGVEVYHFYALCSKILGEAVEYEKEEAAYYDLILSETSARLDEDGPRYDAVLVDEGQDFSDEMLHIVTGLVNKETDNLTIAMDDAQNLYGRPLAWKDNGSFVVQRLHYAYRSTPELWDFVCKFVERDSGNKSAPAVTGFHGPQPEMPCCQNYDEMISGVADSVKGLVTRGDYPPSEIAIAYTTRSLGTHGRTSVPDMLEAALNTRGILCQWVSEDYRAKRSYDITTERVAVSTIHSLKGLDYACVFVIGLDALEGDVWSEARARDLAYVAMTRARHRLMIPYINPEHPLIRRLLACL
jgi:superfamily I DNA/RNA helicase